jgi:hypothetical protein
MAMLAISLKMRYLAAANYYNRCVYLYTYSRDCRLKNHLETSSTTKTQMNPTPKQPTKYGRHVLLCAIGAVLVLPADVINAHCVVIYKLFWGICWVWSELFRINCPTDRVRV